MADKYPPRQAEPGQQFEAADAAGTLHQVNADKDGVVRPSNAAEAAIVASLPLHEPPKRGEKED